VDGALSVAGVVSEEVVAVGSGVLAVVGAAVAGVVSAESFRSFPHAAANIAKAVKAAAIRTDLVRIKTFPQGSDSSVGSP
jgi:ribulose kinase